MRNATMYNSSRTARHNELIPNGYNDLVGNDASFATIGASGAFFVQNADLPLDTNE